MVRSISTGSPISRGSSESPRSRRRKSAVTKRFGLAAVLLSVLALPMQGEFADVARAIDSQRGVSRIWIPFLGLARAAVRVVEPKGVHDFQLATFSGADNLDPE